MLKSNKKPNRNREKIYLDYASGAQPNPSSIHDLGLKEKNKLELARKVVADILNVTSREVVFTSGSTESNNLAILGLVNNFYKLNSKIHIVTTNIEHASVLEVCKHLEKTNKAKVTYVEVEPSGIVDPKKIKKAITSETVLVSVMYANNEIGTIQPIKEIAKEIRHFRKTINYKLETSIYPIFHTDATQAVNYLPISIPQLGVDMMSFNSAKIYGPKGVGALYLRRGVNIIPIMFGGDQEHGLRPGTENVDGIVAFAKALELTEKIKDKEVKRVILLRDYFLLKINKVNFKINGDLVNRLPNNINITIPNIPSDLLVIELSARGVMASSKSACHSGDGKASYVVRAINPDLKETDGSLRFSLGRDTTKSDLDFVIKSLTQILTKLKKWYD